MEARVCGVVVRGQQRKVYKLKAVFKAKCSPIEKKVWGCSRMIEVKRNDQA